MNIKEFFERYPGVIKDVKKVKRVYPMKISNYYLSLIRKKDDPIWKQCIPDIKELQDEVNEEDPLLEEQYSPVPCLIHRYPDRVLLLASNKCATYCRFCTRKRKVGKEVVITREIILNALNYILKHKEIRDVIVSGGDPLMLSDDELEFILKNLRKIPHVEIIRIGTRIPCVLPSRITENLCSMMRKYQPIYVMVHFEHPMEITEESKRACGMLADAGFPLTNQSVLLQGINDDPEVMKDLCQKLLAIRVRPYYLYQADQVKGTEHFRVRTERGMEIMRKLQGYTSGLCLPYFIIDAPGGGKVPVLPNYVNFQTKDRIILENFENKLVEYREPEAEKYEKITKDFRIAIIFNLKRSPEKSQPIDYYAEFDEIDVPLAIKKALRKITPNVDLLEADDNLYEKLKNGNHGFVFNIAEGISGESRESHIPAMLEMLGIPYTGSGVCTQAITLDKRRMKEVLGYYGIPTPKFQFFVTGSEKLNAEMNFPLFVKPNSEGSSKGIRNNSIVKNMKELKERVRQIIKTYKQPALVEEFLPDREFTVALIGNRNPKVLPIVEITFDYLPKNINKIDSYEVKWYWDSPSNPIDPIVCPAKIDKQLEEKIKRIAVKTFKVLGCVDFARIDLRLSGNGVLNILDVNALPGLMPDPKDNSRFPKACYAAGMSYEDIITSVLFSAMKRYGLTEKEIVAEKGIRWADIK